VKVGVFTVTSMENDHFQYVLEQFYKGMKTDVNCFITSSPTLVPCDIAIVMGSFKPNRTQPHHVLKQELIDNNIPIVYIESPLLGRSLDTTFPYFRVGLNGILPDEHCFDWKNKPSDRWEKIKSAMNLNVLPWRTTGEYISVVLQLPNDSSLRGANITKWAAQAVNEIRHHSDMDIVIRPHPLRDRYNFKHIDKSIATNNNVYIEDVNVPLKQHLEKCWCSVAYVSGMSVDSLLAGVPTIGCNSGSFVYDLSHDISTVTNPPKPDRAQWLNDLSYVQWSIPEMASGEAWNHIRNHYDKLCI
jgi:hypothetical protein